MHAAHGVGEHTRHRRYHKVNNLSVETGLAPRLSGAILKSNAADAAFSLELHPWPPDCPLAQSLSAMAHRDVHRRQDDADRIPGILGILMDRANQPVALPEVDSGDGSLRSSRGKEPLAIIDSRPPKPITGMQGSPALGNNLKNRAFADRTSPGRRAIEHAALTKDKAGARSRPVLAAGECIECGLAPIASWLNGSSQLEDRAMTGLAVARSRTVQIARAVGNHARKRIEAVAPAAEVMDR